ncbi:hypothetical protein CUC01_08525 [Akkermansia muciniphila]|nr:hypothetical protein CUB96_05430 [Akkermansia muciniphila]AYR33126.1 hypothetical protein CUC01_08525 [Akkermansia muciniphila]MCO6192436.1 hypothetical protein [Akkermansia muciniphila]MCO6194379.1 hypothetical protein [Akkermansia muciniphila]MCO6196302.1 hypothetical protein [Akkermansia muciniphila]
MAGSPLKNIFSKDSHAFRIPEFPRLPDAVFSLPAVSGSSLWTSYPSSGKFLKRMIPPAAEKWVGKDIPLKK